MGYDIGEIQNLRDEPDPTDELLTMWGHYNHTTLELFILLSRMQHYQAMYALKPLIHEKYYVLLNDGEGNLQKLSDNGQLEKEDLKEDEKNLQVQVKNVDLTKIPPGENIEKVIANNTIKEESIKIFNQSTQHEQHNEIPTSSNNILASMPAIFSTGLPRIPYSELAAATDNWRKENLLGKGGFGTVYKGMFFINEYFLLNIIMIYMVYFVS